MSGLFTYYKTPDPFDSGKSRYKIWSPDGYIELKLEACETYWQSKLSKLFSARAHHYGYTVTWEIRGWRHIGKKRWNRMQEMKQEK